MILELLLCLLLDVDRAHKYPPVSLEKVADGLHKRPRASIVGVVKAVKKESDGDWHVRVEDGGKAVVCEIIPELKMAPPRVGDRVKVWGIVRKDCFHGWWELHPVVGWSKLP